MSIKPRCDLWLLPLSALALLALACTSAPKPTVSKPPPKVEKAPEPPPEPPPACVVFEPERAHPALQEQTGLDPVEVLLCPDRATLEARANGRDIAPETKGGSADAAVMGGLALYDLAIHRIARGARIVPVLFFHTPPRTDADQALLDADPKIQKQLDNMTKGGVRTRWTRTASFIRQHKKNKAMIRAALLRDGYVFHTDPDIARKIYHYLRLTHFFDAPEIFLQRGDAVHRLIKKSKAYHYAEGRFEGAKAELLIFDRIAESREALSTRRAWDVDRLRHRAALDRFEVQTLSPDLLRGQARLFDGTVLEAVSWRKGDRPVLAFVAPEETRDAVLASISLGRRDMAIARGMLQQGEVMAAERLRFDEPRTEEGQQDGILRIFWKLAYRKGMNSFVFNGDRYSVYTSTGRPNVPQVCIDFVYDSAERWSGSWWRGRGEPRGKTRGFLDFSGIVDNRRQVRKLVEFAHLNADKMEMVHYDEDTQIPYLWKERFYDRIEGWSGDARPGDIVVIYGLRGDGRNHWHAFYVYDTDPIKGIPHLLIGNAGYVKVEGWHDTMYKAPRRSITHRIRFKPEWLEAQRAAFEADVGR